MLKRASSSDEQHHAAFGNAVRGFAAGFLATLVFHQLMLAVLHSVGLADRAPYSFDGVEPFGVPALVSIAFWGGLWGVALAHASLLLHTVVNYWLFALLFGALAPTLVNWFISAPLHGLPLGNGWRLPGMLTSVLVNAAWGLGAALLLRLLRRWGEKS